MISLDLSQREVSGPRGKVVLSRQQCALLDRLIRAKGRYVSFDELMDALWPDADQMPDTWLRVIRVQIFHLRLKLREIQGPAIFNRFALGYMIEAA